MAIFDLKGDDKNTRPRRFVPGGDKLKPEDLKDLKTRHATALDQFKSSASYFSKQRQREVDDLKFVEFDEQWDPTVKTQRAGNQAVNGQPPTPARPTVVINQLRAPCQQVANTRRNARLALKFAPKGGGATDDVAAVFEDIVRAAQAESRASLARNWAADRAEKCGLGAYRIDTEFSQEQPDDEASWNDQDLVWRRILNQSSVYLDPSAQEPDFSDARFLFITEDIPLSEYRRRFKDSDLADMEDGEISSVGELTAIGDGRPLWIIPTGEDGEAGTTVRIAEYWEVVERERTKVMLTNGAAAFKDELPEGAKVAEGPQARTRRVVDRQIMHAIINAVEYLEAPQPWNGVYIPVPLCVGEESNVNGERRWQGIVRPGRDAAVSYNVMRSAQIEAIALATKAPYIGFMETIEPYLEWWKNSAVRNYFILPIKAAYDKAGNLLPAPVRTVQEPAIQAMTLAAAAAKDDVHTTTGIPPVALGQLDPHDRSGKAIQALQGQAEVGSSGYLDNFVEITLAYEGKVVRDLIPRIYDRPGRIVPALGLDEKRRMVMLNYPYVEGPNGQPIKALDGWEKGQPFPPQIAGPDGKPLEVHYYDLSAGQFSVAPTVGKSFATKRKEVNDAIQNIMQVVAPPMAMALTPAFIESLDTPDALKLAEIAKKALPPELASAYQDGDDGPNAEIQMLQQQVQQLQAAIQGKQAEKQAEAQAKGQIDIAKTQQQEEGENQRTAAELASRERIEMAKLALEQRKLEVELEIELAKIGHQQAIARAERETDMLHQHADREHDTDLTERQQAHEREMTDRGQAHEREMGEQSHLQAVDLQERQPSADATGTP